MEKKKERALIYSFGALALSGMVGFVSTLSANGYYTYKINSLMAKHDISDKFKENKDFLLKENVEDFKNDLISYEEFKKRDIAIREAILSEDFIKDNIESNEDKNRYDSYLEKRDRLSIPSVVTASALGLGYGGLGVVEINKRKRIEDFKNGEDSNLDDFDEELDNEK